MLDFIFLKKKVEKQVPRKVFVPEEHKVAVLQAFDEYSSAPKRKNKLLRYRFWKLVEEVCPETTTGKWKANMDFGTNPHFTEVFE